MNAVKNENKFHATCISEYSSMMKLFYNIENSVKRSMKAREATIYYNNCIYVRQKYKEKIDESNR